MSPQHRRKRLGCLDGETHQVSKHAGVVRRTSAKQQLCLLAQGLVELERRRRLIGPAPGDSFGGLKRKQARALAQKDLGMALGQPLVVANDGDFGSSGHNITQIWVTNKVSPDIDTFASWPGLVCAARF